MISHVFLMFGNLVGGDMILIFVMVLLLFGGRKVPELMKGLGQGIREFNNAKNAAQREIEEGMKEPEKKELPKEEPKP
jgi:sec-independent protein translocase protein TatA